MARPPLPWDTPLGARFIGPADAVFVACNAARDQVMAAAAAANSNTARQVLAVGEVFARGVAPDERRKMNQALGAMGQASVLASYDQSVTRRKNSLGNTRPYRKNNYGKNGKNRRYAGRRLRNALNDESFFTATPDDLLFINETALNKAAVQWARLNAGAGGAAGGTRGPRGVTWSNVVVGVLGVDIGPRPGFLLPRGYWFSAGEGQVVSASEGRKGRDEFYPMGTGPHRGRRKVESRAKLKDGEVRKPALARRRPSKGIRARHFLEAGTDKIAEQFPVQVELLYRNLWDQGVVGAAGSGAVVVGPRPRRLKKSTFPF